MVFAALPILTGCGGTRSPAAPVVANLLLISIDSLRADHLGCYGYRRDTSPTLDRLATEGIRFANAESPSSWTLPAHATLLSGVSQWRHGATTADGTIAADVPLLAEILRARGFTTAGFYSGPFLDPAFGFGRGFDEYVCCQSPGVVEPSHRDGGFERSHEDVTNPRVQAAIHRWVESAPKQPFFAFVHMWDVHYDYIPPSRYVRMFDPDYRGPLDGRHIAGDGFPLDLSSRDLAHLVARYDGEIRWTDDTFAAILDVFEGAGMLDDTLVVVTADHGEEFLDHGGKGHQKTLYDEVTHVPLILWARGRLPAGRAIARPVTLADVVPTVMTLLGLPVPSGLDGQSLVAQWATPGAGHPPVVSLLYPPSGQGAAILAASIHDGDRKVSYVEHGHRWREYALDRDPHEQAPLPVTRTDLQAALEDRMRRDHDRLVRQLAINAGQRTRTSVPEGVTRQLRALGYIE